MFKSLFISGREVNYPRNQLFLSSLQKICDVHIIGTEKTDVSSGGINFILNQSIKGIIKTALGTQLQKFDFIFVGFFGQILMIPLGLVFRKTIFFDAFISSFDTLIHDRKLGKPYSFLSKLLYLLDKYSCQLADIIFIDTQTHANYFYENFGVPLEKLQVVFVGCDEDLFFPQNVTIDENKVLYYCSFLPLHGVDVVVKAAEILQRTTPIKFKIIGNGIEYQNIQNLTRKLGVRNMEFVPPIPLQKIPQEIANSAICLGGHFGLSEKAKRVIPGKTFQILAMGKPVIVGDNDANHELLTHMQDAWFCKMNDPESLANAIATLNNDPSLRESLGMSGYKTFGEKASYSVLKEKIQKVIIGLIK